MRLLTAAFLLLLVPSGSASGQGVELTAARKGEAIIAGVVFHWGHEKELIDALREGLESRVTLTLRLFEGRAVSIPFFEGFLVEEKSVSQSAFFDFLEQRFIVESEGGGRRMFESSEELIRGFFTWKDVRFASPRSLVGPFMTARIQFDPVRLAPPLTIVSLVGGTGTFTSPWTREEVGSK